MQLNANLQNTQSFDEYIPLPPGDYLVTIVDSQIRETKAGESQLIFIYQVRGGEHDGEQVFDRLPLWSANPKAVNVAQRRLKTVAVASGHKNPNFIADTSEFHGLSMMIRTALRDYNGQQYVDIKSYSPTTQTQPQNDFGPAFPQSPAPNTTAQSGAMPPPPPPAPAMQKPWE